MSKVAIVTGANQGLGYALVEGLCRALGHDAAVYLTARSPASGEAAVRSLREQGLRPELLEVDVTVPSTLEGLAEVLRTKHGGVDIVISNAAARIEPEVAPGAQVRRFIDTNNLGTTRVIRALGPLLKDGGRFLVVASSFGSLLKLPPTLRSRFDVGAMSLEDLDGVMLDYAAAVEQGTAEAAGWPAWINVASKVGQVATMKVFAREMRAGAERRDLLINAVCPGLVDTAASRPWFADMSSARSPDEAAIDVLWLASLPQGTREPYGHLVRYRQIVPWQ
jgi:carbonyl reductase 1